MDATNATKALPSDVRSIIDAPSYDESYRFGRRPTTGAPFPFTELQFARLLIIRGRIRAALSASAQVAG